MGYADVREQDVLAAVRRCDELGHEAFLNRYGFHEALRYILVHNGWQYDSKAIIGAAHEFLDGTPLVAGDFSGGRATVRRHLTRLGFVVQERSLSPQLLLQPRGGPKDNGPRNFKRTVVDGVRLDDHAAALGTDLEVLRSLFRDGIAKLWGSTPAQGQNAKSKAISGRRVGDHVLFYADRSFIATATIIHLFHNPEAARSIWPVSAEGAPFEHLMALGDVRVLDAPHPATDAVRQVSKRDALRSLTLVPAEEYAAIADLLPAGQRPAPQAEPVVRHKIDMSATDLVKSVTVLHRHHPEGSRHEPLALLWAIGQLVADAPRLHRWHVFKPQVGELLAEFGGAGSSITPEVPFWHLRGTRVWEVDGVQPESNFKPRPGSFDASDPSAGFTEEAYQRLRDVSMRTRVINALRVRHLADIEDNTLLLERVGLADYATASGASKPSAKGDRQSPGRRQSTRQEIDRNVAIAKQVKALHDDRCQLCGNHLMLSAGFHSEAAHIRGLGQPHDGPDELSNLLCLCPNCHAQFDNFAVYVDEDDVVRHVLGQKYLGKFRRHPLHEIDDGHLRRHREMCETTEAVPHNDV